MRILDFAAGNGRVGVELRLQLGRIPGIDRLIATDLLESAKMAALRDRRKGLYDEYVVADLTQSEVIEQFKAERFNVVTICAALGPGDGDMPLEVVDAAIEILRPGGLLVFTVNEGAGADAADRYGGFLSSVKANQEATHWKSMRKIDMVVYNHRLNVKGEWIEYTALLYEKVDRDNVITNEGT